MRSDYLTPSQIVAELDRYIIGQDDAKRAVAVALRNRYRRDRLPPEIRDEVIPKNILMIGPTGVGKTELARRLARLANAPFVKVEATKFTEVGYVGRDVDSMVRDLVQTAFKMVEDEKLREVQPKAREMAIERVLDHLQNVKPREDEGASDVRAAFQIFGQLLGQSGMPTTATGEANVPPAEPAAPGEQLTIDAEGAESDTERVRRPSRVRLRDLLLAGKLDDREIDVEVEASGLSFWQGFSPAGMEEMVVDMREMLGSMVPKKRKTRKVRVAEALELYTLEESEQLIDREEISREAVSRAEEHGIIFLDELDKVTLTSKGAGPDVSREGVQRDLLPIIEGSTVLTKYGTVDTEHILFIAAGSFHASKPSDLIPELQGRLPIRVELTNLDADDFIRILREPENALIKQYAALLATEGVSVEFTDDGIEQIARLAAEVNDQTENIGARRLHTMMEHLLEDVSFRAPELAGQTVLVDAAYVKERLSNLVKSEDLSRYIL
jgi:ATP-dependent HslUV protease ATP-binding subunit HslU